VPPASTSRLRPRTTLQRRVIRATTERLSLKGAAIFFALVLWFIVNSEQPSEGNTAVELRVITDTLVELREPRPRITALVVGRQRELLKLSADPPVIRRTFTADTPDSVTLRLEPADVEIPTGIEARVSDVRPRQITLRFAVRETRMVPVASALGVTTDNGWRLAGRPRFEPESVRISGPRSLVRRVDAVPTVAQTLTVRNGLTQDSVALDTARLRGLRVSPARVRVRVSAARDTVVVDTSDAALDDTTRRAARDTSRRTPPIPPARRDTEPPRRTPPDTARTVPP
jgi:hypothetical protein